MTRERFIEGMSHAAATVNVVTTDGPAGRAGVTVSAMCSVTADPPALLVCVHHKSPACAAIRDNGLFCLNVLRDDQALISDAFAGRFKTPGGDKFACADWRTLATGAPALANPLVAFDCALTKHFRSGTHQIFLGEVREAVVNAPGAALIYANRAYGTPARLNLAPSRGGEAAAAALAVGCFVTLGPYFMPNLLARFMAAQPQTEVTISEGAQERLSAGLAAGDFDLVLTYEQGLGARFATEALAEVSPYVLLPAAHPLAEKPALGLDDLAKEPMVLLDVAPSRTYFCELFRAAGYEPDVRFRSPSFETVRGIVGHGLGYSLLATKPANAMTYDGKALTARPLRDAVAKSRIVLAWRAETPPAAGAAAFVESCKAFFAAPS